jgi:hypothetical protein
MSKRAFYGRMTFIWIIKKCGVTVKNVLIMWLITVQWRAHLDKVGDFISYDSVWTKRILLHAINFRVTIKMLSLTASLRDNRFYVIKAGNIGIAIF